MFDTFRVAACMCANDLDHTHFLKLCSRCVYAMKSLCVAVKALFDFTVMVNKTAYCLRVGVHVLTKNMR